MKKVTKKCGDRPKVEKTLSKSARRGGQVQPAVEVKKPATKNEEPAVSKPDVPVVVNDEHAGEYTDVFDELTKLANRVSGICAALTAKEKKEEERLQREQEQGHTLPDQSEEDLRLHNARIEEGREDRENHVQDLRLAQELYDAATPHCDSFSRKQAHKLREWQTQLYLMLVDRSNNASETAACQKVGDKRKRADDSGNTTGENTSSASASTTATTAAAESATTPTVAAESSDTLVHITLMSFGHKIGRPFNQLRVFDIRALPHCKCSGVSLFTLHRWLFYA
jgi:hypothetical protein